VAVSRTAFLFEAVEYITAFFVFRKGKKGRK